MLAFDLKKVEFATSELYAGVAHKYIIVIGTTILYYDYFLTLSREIAWVWNANPRITWINLLFYLNRYVPLFAHIGFLLQAVWLPPENPNRLATCVHLWTYHGYLSIVLQLFVTIFLILRTYALYNGDKKVLVILVTMAAAIMAIGLWAVTGGLHADTAVEDDLLILRGCSLPMAVKTARRLAAAWAGLLALDLTIFVMTLYKAFLEIKYGGSKIMRVLLRDGAMYFGIVAALHVAQIVAVLGLGPYYKGIVTTIANALASILMSRLLFNIRDPTLCCRNRFIQRSGRVYDTEPIWTHCTETGEVVLDNEEEHTQQCRERNPANMSIGFVSQPSSP